MTFISLFLFLKKEDSGLLDMLINRQHAKENLSCNRFTLNIRCHPNTQLPWILVYHSFFLMVNSIIIKKKNTHLT